MQRDIDAADNEARPKLLANKVVDVAAREEAVDGWGYLRYVDMVKQEKSEAVKGVVDHIAGLGAASVKLPADTTRYIPVRRQPAAPKQPRQEHVARLFRADGADGHRDRSEQASFFQGQAGRDL